MPSSRGSSPPQGSSLHLVRLLRSLQAYFLRISHGGGLGGGIGREFGVDMYTLAYLKWIINKDLLCSMWNSAEHYVTT